MTCVVIFSITVLLISNDFYRTNLQPETYEVFDELRAGGADVLNSVEDVHLLLHLHVFEHVAGCTQQSTATRSVPGRVVNQNKEDLSSASTCSSLSFWGKPHLFESVYIIHVMKVLLKCVYVSNNASNKCKWITPIPKSNAGETGNIG